MSCVTKCGIVLTTPKREELLRNDPTASMSNRCHILGRGSYGTVFKAIYREHAVALKVIRKSAICTLKNEAHALNWRHRNIVRLLKLEETPELGLIIMERSNGLCLQRVLNTLPLHLVHRVLITLDVLAALRFCHSQKVLHLDVKPANVLITLGPRDNSIGKRSYICKLCDFGSSIKLGESYAKPPCAKGTLRYMSPEALRSGCLGCAADIYSLAITMWQLQARRLPFYTLTCNETIAYQVVKHHLRPDNYTRLEELKASGDQDNSMSVICIYQSGFNPKLNAVLSTDLYRKARRNLNFDTANGRVVKRRVPIRKKQPRLAEHFPNPFNASNTLLEIEYSELYRSCWISEPEMRLKSFELQQRLELISSKINCNLL